MSTDYDHGGDVFAVARQLGVEPEEILDFSASINPLGPPAGVGRAIQTALALLIHYPDSDSTELRGALARHHGIPAEARPRNESWTKASVSRLLLHAGL